MVAPTILLVDTHEDSRLIYTAALRHYGLEVVQADCTPLVVELARTHPPALVVLELSVRSAASWTIAAALRSEASTAALPLVALGSTGLPEHRDRALALGCRSYLLKPVSPMQLVAEVRRVLDQAIVAG